ncbi:hypothetical protein BMJ22_09745 [Sinorhizobium medicae]|nr:DUF982 domain-containing protein [Sinorhizobium medicae]MDX0957947.1 DUF982 domain-containing protein [Sinorhizobium medicae]PLU82805.1 hypothetical protein BMJ22_09745 [Sinorhizobium medicae]
MGSPSVLPSLTEGPFRQGITEIPNLEDAIDFVEEWPQHERAVIHDAPSKTCYMAHDGFKPVQVARHAVRAANAASLPNCLSSYRNFSSSGR